MDLPVEGEDRLQAEQRVVVVVLKRTHVEEEVQEVGDDSELLP